MKPDEHMLLDRDADWARWHTSGAVRDVITLSSMMHRVRFVIESLKIIQPPNTDRYGMAIDSLRHSLKALELHAEGF